MLQNATIIGRYAELQRYVGWTDDDARRVQSLRSTLEPHLAGIVDDFYAEIDRHQGTRRVITGGQPQTERLKKALLNWLRELLTGPFDHQYILRRWRIGKRHLELGLDPIYVQAALGRLRVGLLDAIEQSWQRERPANGDALRRSLNMLLDLELAKIQDAYHREHVRLVEENARLQSELAFRAIVEAAPCMMIIVLSPDQTILYFNSIAEQVTGYTSAEVIGKDVVALLDGPELRAGLAQEKGTEFEGEIRCKDGSPRWILWNCERLPAFRGHPANLVVGLDRTEIKEIQHRAWQSERLAELGVIASGLAHEIRNPLNSIRFNLLNVRDGIAEAANAEEIAVTLKDIAEEVDRLEGIMREFLHLARPDPAQFELVDLRELLENVVRLIQGPCNVHNVELNWDCSPGVRAAADPNQLKQVLLNLSINAQQAMPNGGKLDIRCWALAEEVRIEVSDNGPGIPTESRDRIFQPFFSTHKDGTGLGLSICRRLVEQMHGSIDFTSDPGKGTTFVIDLPRVASAIAEEIPDA